MTTKTNRENDKKFKGWIDGVNCKSSSTIRIEDLEAELLVLNLKYDALVLEISHIKKERNDGTAEISRTNK